MRGKTFRDRLQARPMSDRKGCVKPQSAVCSCRAQSGLLGEVAEQGAGARAAWRARQRGCLAALLEGLRRGEGFDA
jgi:hypothetical protein